MRQTYAKRLAVALDRLRTLLPEAGPDQYDTLTDAIELVEGVMLALADEDRDGRIAYVAEGNKERI